MQSASISLTLIIEYDFNPAFSVIYNPTNYFPTYTQSEERKQQIQKELNESDKPLAHHYDARGDNREKGPLNYTFGPDEQSRMDEQQRLKDAHSETIQNRRAAGAVDMKVEGMSAESSTSTATSTDKRKREIEQRRADVLAKRRKKNPPPPSEVLPPPPPPSARGPSPDPVCKIRVSR